MAALYFLTTNQDKHTEIAELLHEVANVEVEQRSARLPVPPSNAPGEVARFRALEAFKVLRAPVFAEALAVELADGLVSGASYRQAFEQHGGSSWLKKHDGKTGTAHIAVGYTADGETSQLFEAAIRGRLTSRAQGDGIAAWERHWIPEGATKTLAALADDGDAPPQDEPYVALAKSLRG